MNKFVTICALMLAGWLSGNAQTYNTINGSQEFIGNIDIRDKTADTTKHRTAILESNTTTKGWLPPRLTHTQMNAISPVYKGMLIFNNDSSGFYYYNGSAWVTFSTQSATITGLRTYSFTSNGSGSYVISALIGKNVDQFFLDGKLDNTANYTFVSGTGTLTYTIDITGSKGSINYH